MLKSLNNLIGQSGLGKLRRYSQEQNSKGLYQSDNENIFDFLDIIKNWPVIVGEKLAKNTVPLKIQDKTLIILTKHAAFAQQLNYLSEKIKERLEEEFPKIGRKVSGIKFQVSTRYFDQMEAQRAKNLFSTESLSKSTNSKSKYNPDYQKARLDCQEEFEIIEDSELKELMISLAVQKKLNRQQHS